MTFYEIVNFNKELLGRLMKIGFKPDDCRWIELYAEYGRMKFDGDKVTYIVSFLSDRYKVSERKIYAIIKRFGTDCTDRAV
ncbi:MAG: hypothetical protein LBU37_09555 [Tannerellaceae bacterium]|jgi:hypothetical protein|nr:hypothetical protein [Tannerellaceae bacterium]